MTCFFAPSDQEMTLREKNKQHEVLKNAWCCFFKKEKINALGQLIFMKNE